MKIIKCNQVSRAGMIVAGQYAHELPTFSDSAEAEEILFAQRDAGLQELHITTGLAEKLDYSADSLKVLERWFFENNQPTATDAGFSISHAIAFYYGEVLCRKGGFLCVVQAFPFANGRYEIGVQRPLLIVMLTRGKQLQAAGNKRMQSLWREFQTYVR